MAKLITKKITTAVIEEVKIVPAASGKETNHLGMIYPMKEKYLFARRHEAVNEKNIFISI